MSIYDIPQEVNELFQDYMSSFDQDTGEQIATDEEVEARLQALKEKENKVGDLIQWMLATRANAQAESAMFDFEIERLSKHKARTVKTAEKMESMLTFFLPPDSLQEMTQYGNWRVGYRKSESVKIEDETKIPNEFIKIPEPKPAPDKVAIKKAINDGITVPGATIEVKNNLQIK